MYLKASDKTWALTCATLLATALTVRAGAEPEERAPPPSIGGRTAYVVTRGDSEAVAVREPLRGQASIPVRGEARIVFSARQDGDEDLYIVNGNGSGLRKLTHNGVSDVQPLASPNGEWIAYQRFRARGHRPDQYLIRTDGTAARATGMGSMEATSWSPDSRFLVYTHFELRPRLFDVATGRAGRRFGPSGCCIDVAWAPNGAHIAGIVEPFVEGPSGIALIDARTLKWRWLYRGETGFANPVWSPDSDEVAFTLSSDTTRPDARPLAVVSVRSRRLRRVGIVGPEQDDAAELAWAPGPQLVFPRLVAKDRAALFSWDGNRVRRIRVAGSARDPHWSTDGRALAFRWSRFGSTFGESDIAVVRRREVVPVTPLGTPGLFTFGGWSFGRPLRRTSPLPSYAGTTSVRTNVPKAVSLDVAGRTAAISGDCGSHTLWTFGARTRAVPSGCPRGAGRTTALALTRSRLAWVVTWIDRRDGQDCLMLVDTSARRPRPVEHAKCLIGPSYAVFPPESIDLLDSGGGTLAYSHSHSCYFSDEKCVRSPRGVFVMRDESPRRVVARSTLLAVEAGTFVVRRGARTLAIRSGREVRVLTPKPHSIRLRGEVIAATAADDKLRLLSVRSGRVLRTIRLRPSPIDSPRIEDLNRRYVVLAVDGALRIVRARDGRAVQLDLGAAVAPLRARLEDGRLIVSYNRRGHAPFGRAIVLEQRELERAFRRRRS
jgi:Tol biopolymer transport system component